MKRLLLSLLLLFVAYLFVLVSPSHAAAKLSFDDYMKQVEEKHAGLRAAEAASEGAALRAGESSLLYMPNLFGTTSYTIDKSPMSPAISRDSVNTMFYQLGVSQGTPFGLTGRLYYNLYDIQTKNPSNSAFFEEGGTYWSAKPYLEVTQSLWRNGFGRETRAQVELGRAGAELASHNQGFAATMLRANAEGNYLRLASLRTLVNMQNENLNRAQKIRAYQSRRARMELADRVDFLQADASAQYRALELRRLQHEEREAALNFNLGRGVNSAEVPEELEDMAPEKMVKLSVPERKAAREDVLAAEAQMRVTQANAEVGIERQNPTLDLFGNANLNGRDRARSAALSESTGTKYPTATVGVRLNVPLGLGTMNDARTGYRLEVAAAKDAYERKLLEAEADWNNLTQRFAEAKERLELAVKLEEAQRLKMNSERSRQERGRTTTYLMLVAEDDFANAQTARIRAQVDVIGALVQMRTYATEKK